MKPITSPTTSMDTLPAAHSEVAGSTPASPRRRSRSRFEWSFVMLAVPALVVYLGFLVGPVIAGFYFAFTQWDGINPPKWIGIDNFTELAADPAYAAALMHTALFTAIILVGQVGIGLGLAMLLNRPMRGISFMRGVFFAPALMSTAVIALIWGFIYSPTVGVLNWLAGAIGLEDSLLANVLGISKPRFRE